MGRISRAGNECITRLGIAHQESLPDLGANLKLLRTNGRPQPRQDGSRITQILNRSLQNTTTQAAPASMGSGHLATGGVTEKHRKTVRCHHHTCHPRLGGHTGIRGDRTRLRQLNNVSTMNLVKPTERLSAGLSPLPKQGPIFRNIIGMISHMRAEVQGLPRRLTDPAHSRRACGMNPGRSGPVRDNHRQFRRHGSPAP